MKAERRHELEHNDLDDLLTKAVRFLRENGALLGILAAVIVLGVLTYNLLVANRSASAPAGAWNDYFYALSEKDPERAMKKFVDEEDDATSPVVLQAKLTLADLQLARAAQQLFEDRKAAEETLAAAEKNYQDVEKSSARPELKDRARIGLGEVYESRNNPEEALKYYEMVLKSSPDSAQGKVAARAQKRLTSEANREFLTWFSAQQPAKKASSGGAGLPFGPGSPLPELPNFSPLGNQAPGEDGLEFPGAKLPDAAAPGAATESAETPAPAATEEAKPAEKAEPMSEPAAPPAATTEEAAPAESAPAESAPAESAPAESAPAESAPAESAPAESAPAESAPAAPEPAAPAEETSPEKTPE
jgi:tetratricopeptide (TPR) repeat protein